MAGAGITPEMPIAVAGLETEKEFTRVLLEDALEFDLDAARSPQDLENAFVAMVKDRAQAVLLLPDSIFYQARDQLGQLALRHRLPMIGWRPDFASAGALMAYGASLTADYRRAGVLVGKILNGTKPSDLPVEEPAKLELIVNLRTAKTLGLTIPQALLLRTDQVIE